MSFTDEEIAYLRSQRLARLATMAADGQPDVAPVGYEFDGTHFYVGGGAPSTRLPPANLRCSAIKAA